ncbi:MAG: LCP family protein [Chloroflexi bacterium]|nr:LCP family protein [Chloroflexota bacterium]
MTAKKPSRARRFAGFIVFRLVPALFILGILWFGYGAAQSVVRRVNEQIEAGQRQAVYADTAEAIQPTLVTHTPTDVSAATPTPAPTLAGAVDRTRRRADMIVLVAQSFATNTLEAPIILPPSNTPAPEPSPTETASPPPTDLPTAAFTPEPAPTQTPRALPTLIPVSTVDPAAAAAAPTAIPTIVPTLDRHGYDLVNILLLGTDGELTGDNFDRTDTMIVVSINRSTGTVAMLSLPRDLYVYIPGWTMQRLNLAYTRGQQVGWTDGGFGLIRETLLYNLGINIHYYAIVNLSGFKEIIDTLDGIDVAVDCAIQDRELIGAAPPEQASEPDDQGYYTLPVGYYQLNGEGALWYARSRHNSSDFDRGRRQQQILRAIWRKARDTGQLAKFPELWSQATQVVQTNLAFDDMLSLLPIALSLDTANMEQFTLARLYHTTPWQPPDGQFVQLPNYEPIRQLLDDFYQPPTTSQVVVEGEQITVYNGTTGADWDRVAAERLAWDGFNAVAAGQADNTNYTDTIVIDYTGRTKGSSLPDLVQALNVRPENVRIEPDPNREADFVVILGSSYNSCTVGGVLPVEENTGG